MKKNKIKLIKPRVFIITGAAALVLVSLFFYWLYKEPITNLKVSVFKTFPFPAAVVEGRVIPISELIIRNNTSKLLASTSESEDKIKSSILEEVINEEKYNILAQKNGVSVNQKEIDSEYSLMASKAPLEGKSNIEGVLKTYGINSGVYKDDVIKPALIKENLHTWFYLNKELNKSAYEKASGLMKRIENGESLSQLAQNFTEDSSGKAVKGDLGFVGILELRPEMREAIEKLNVNDVKIIASSIGIHIVNLEEKNNGRFHLRQIFLTGSNFNDWAKSQTQNYKVYSLIKF